MDSIGEVQSLKSECIFEWRIENFFSLSEEDGKDYSSPYFLFDEESWFLKIYPNGASSTKSIGYLDIYLFRKRPGPSKRLTWSLGLKTVDGKTEYKKTITDIIPIPIHEANPCFLHRSVFLEKKSLLLPSDILTIICTMEKTIVDDAGNNVIAKCSYCKENFHNESFSSHEEKCLDKPIRCPTCNDDVELQKRFEHECPMRVKAFEKLAIDLTGMLNTEELSDITIKVKDKEFRLHRLILTGRSPYFKTMLNTEMKEKITNAVSINDCEPGIFQSFIHFVYTGKIDDLSVKNVCDLYEIADKYQEDQLKEECLCFMQKAISVGSFFDFIVIALKYDEKELFQNATDLFCRKAKEIMHSVKWQTFVEQYPTHTSKLFIKVINYYNL